MLILSPDAEILGLILMGKPVANVAFGDDDGRMLYMTSQNHLTPESRHSEQASNSTDPTSL